MIQREWSYSDSCASLVVIVVLEASPEIETRRGVGPELLMAHILPIRRISEWFFIFCRNDEELKVGAR